MVSPRKKFRVRNWISQNSKGDRLPKSAGGFVFDATIDLSIAAVFEVPKIRTYFFPTFPCESYLYSCLSTCFHGFNERSVNILFSEKSCFIQKFKNRLGNNKNVLFDYFIFRVTTHFSSKFYYFHN